MYIVCVHYCVLNDAYAQRFTHLNFLLGVDRLKAKHYVVC